MAQFPATKTAELENDLILMGLTIERNRKKKFSREKLIFL